MCPPLYPRTTAAKSASAAVVALQAQLGLGAKGSPESEGRAMACKRVGTGRMKTKETDPIPINELQVNDISFVAFKLASRPFSWSKVNCFNSLFWETMEKPLHLVCPHRPLFQQQPWPHRMPIPEGHSTRAVLRVIGVRVWWPQLLVAFLRLKHLNLHNKLQALPCQKHPSLSQMWHAVTQLSQHPRMQQFIKMVLIGGSLFLMYWWTLATL